jgi:uroporphyrinogen decarboxylase
MTSLERLQAALNHKEADRVPLDLGGGRYCRFHVGIYQKIIDYFNIKDTLCVGEKIGQLAYACEELLQKLESDIRAPFPLFQKKTNSEAAQKNEWEDKDSYFLRDDWGTVMRMPKNGGLYYDIIEVPLPDMVDAEELNYTFPVPPRIAPEAVEQAKAYRAAGYPVFVTEHFGNGFLHTGPRIFGYEDWMIMLALEDKKIIGFLESLLEVKMRYWDAVTEAFGDYVDVVIESDDLGMQSGPFIAPELFRKLIKPYHKRLYEYIHSKTKAKIFLHTCGSIVELLPDLIEIGVDIVNPVQINAVGMDPVLLKREFGKDIVFWGGGIDTQRVLPQGKPQEIRDHVRRNVEIFGKDGGFVFATVHNAQSDVPVENIIAMWEAFKECRNYF